MGLSCFTAGAANAFNLIGLSPREDIFNDNVYIYKEDENEHAFAERGVGLGKGPFRTAGALKTGGTLFQVVGVDFLLTSSLPINWLKGTGLLFSVKFSILKRMEIFLWTNS